MIGIFFAWMLLGEIQEMQQIERARVYCEAHGGTLVYPQLCMPGE